MVAHIVYNIPVCQIQFENLPILQSVEDQMSIPEVKLEVAVVLISGKNFEEEKKNSVFWELGS